MKLDINLISGILKSLNFGKKKKNKKFNIVPILFLCVLILGLIYVVKHADLPEFLQNFESEWSENNDETYPSVSTTDPIDIRPEASEWSVVIHGQTISYPSSAAQGSNGMFAYVNDNTPFFAKSQLTKKSYESYGEKDELGRCTSCIACIGKDLMPDDPREAINSVTPTGWHNKRYDFVDAGWVYNRCHLIGFQLAGENANDKNLITGTRALNVEGMLPFENIVADYVKNTENHVLYRVTPIFVNDDLLARGVLMEAQSVENSNDLSFCIFCFNVQKGVILDYATGENQEQKS